jgi:hypothetical protein
MAQLPQNYPYRLTPSQHRREAAVLYAHGAARASELAYHHEIAAMLIEKRLNAEPVSPSISPEGDFSLTT